MKMHFKFESVAFNEEHLEIILNTVKPVYNGHPWDLKKWPFDRGV